MRKAILIAVRDDIGGYGDILFALKLAAQWVNLHKRRNFPFASLNHLQSQYPSQIKEGFVGSFLPKIKLPMQIHMAPRQY